MDYNVTPTEYSKGSFGGSEALKSQISQTIVLGILNSTTIHGCQMQTLNTLFVYHPDPVCSLKHDLHKIFSEKLLFSPGIRIYCVWCRTQGLSIHQAVVEKVVLRRSPLSDTSLNHTLQIFCHTHPHRWCRCLVDSGDVIFSSWVDLHPVLTVSSRGLCICVQTY